MAALARFLQNEPTIKTFGTEIVDPGERWTWETLRSEIVYSLVFAPIPPKVGQPAVWTDEAIAQQRDEWASLLEGLLAHRGVTTVTQAQELDDANQLRDYIYVTVRSSSGLAVRQLRFRMADVLPPSTVGDVIDATAAELDAAEAGA